MKRIQNSGTSSNSLHSDLAAARRTRNKARRARREQEVLLEDFEAMSRKAAADKKAEHENKKTKKETGANFFLDYIK